MTKCRQAMEEEIDCGKTICCKECEDRDTCKTVCTVVHLESCPDAITEDQALAQFQKNEIKVIRAMVAVLKQKTTLEEQEKTIRQKLTQIMDFYGITVFDCDVLTVTYIKPSTKTTIDSKALKKDLPDIAAKYSKVSNVAASVRIALK